MKKLIVSLISILSLNAYSVETGPQGRKSSYYYFELHPKEKLVLNFLADKVCTGDSDKISFREFESTASYPTLEGKGESNVRIKSLYVESFSICSTQPVGKLEKKIVIGPFKTQMTHIRLTTSEGIQVRQLND